MALVLLLIPFAAESSQSEAMKAVLRWLGTSTHYEAGLSGNIRSEDLAYFGIIIAAALALARADVDSLRWR